MILLANYEIASAIAPGEGAQPFRVAGRGQQALGALAAVARSQYFVAGVYVHMMRIAAGPIAGVRTTGFGINHKLPTALWGGEFTLMRIEETLIVTFPVPLQNPVGAALTFDTDTLAPGGDLYDMAIWGWSQPA